LRIDGIIDGFSKIGCDLFSVNFTTKLSHPNRSKARVSCQPDMRRKNELNEEGF
jgi:hypothetical protein